MDGHPEPHGIEAMGNPVPEARIRNARSHAEQMGCSDVTFVDVMAKHIEKDEPASAMNVARDHVDLTGAYRLIAALCAGESSESGA